VIGPSGCRGEEAAEASACPESSPKQPGASRSIITCWRGNGQYGSRFYLSDPLAMPVRRGWREGGAKDAGDAEEDEGAKIHSLVVRGGEEGLRAAPAFLPNTWCDPHRVGCLVARSPRDAKAVP